MSRKGDCWDNAVAESFFSSLKTERGHRWLYRSRDDARRDIFEYIEVFYNRVRLHSTLGYLSPAQFEAAYLANAAQRSTRTIGYRPIDALPTKRVHSGR